MMGRPFWEQGIELFDAVHNVGVRSHYKATLLALPMLRRTAAQSGLRSLIVNTNSGGCLFYVLNVPSVSLNFLFNVSEFTDASKQTKRESQERPLQ